MIQRKYRILINSLILTIPALLVLFVILYLLDASIIVNSTCNPPSEYVGKSEGKAEIFVSWCKQDSLPYSFTVQPDGKVVGFVGDALLVNGIFEKNRSVIGKMLHIRTNYIIRAKLVGPIIEKENIVRNGVFIFREFNKQKKTWDICIQTTGTKGGGKDSMTLTASTREL
jgi:hypothetical protein